MASKEEYCYRIVSKYGLIVDFDGDHPTGWVEDPVDGETLKQWKQRVLGDAVENVTVFVPSEGLSPQTRLATIQQKAHADHVRGIFGALSAKDKDARKNSVNKATEKTQKIWSDFPKDALKGLQVDLKDQLQPSTVEFLDRLIRQTPDDIKVEEIFEKLLLAFDANVRSRSRLELTLTGADDKAPG